MFKINPDLYIGDTGKKLEDIVNCLSFKPGDTFSCTYKIFDGMITSSTTSIVIPFTFPKKINGLNISITKFDAELRGIKGYLNGQSGKQNLMSSSYKVGVVQEGNDYTAHINIVKTTAFTNVDNNTPVSVAGDITFKFD